MANQKHHNKETIFLWNVAGTIYSFVMVAIGLATSLYFAVDNQNSTEASFHRAFFIALYASGLLTIVGLLTYVCKCRRHSFHASENAPEESPRETALLPYIAFVGTGFNYYLLLGLAVFGLTSIILSLTRIIDITLRCPAGEGAMILAQAALQAMFILLQTGLILILREAVFLRHKSLIKMALAHLFTVNLCAWCHSAVAEVREHVNKITAKPAETNVTNATAAESRHAASVSCLDAHAQGIYADLGTFLTPAHIEFSLLSAPMLLQLLSLVGDYTHVLAENRYRNECDCKQGEVAVQSPASVRRWYSLSHLGFVASTLLVIGTVTCIVLDYKMASEYASALIYMSQELLLNLLGIVLVLTLRFRLKQLTFAKQERHSFDNRLLLVTIFGALVYNLLNMAFMIDNQTNYNPLLAFGDIANGVLGILQAVTLLDGLRRRSTVQAQINARPGRSLVAALIGVNLALWIIDTFETKKVELAF